MSRPDHGRPAVPPVDAGQSPAWPTSPPPHRPLGPADPAETGPYRLEAVLGAGGMGRVFLGRTPAGSAVAVKVVHREYAGDAAFRKRFAQEVAAARRVQGLYTVPVVDADLRADEPWLATAYVPGPSLQHAVADSGPLPEDAALGLIARVAEALQSIHAAGVVHRDLKPSNIILTAEGPKVIDFGIARAADVTAVTAAGMRSGTPAYMAPEYIRGQSVTEAGDVFALGVVAHFAATGRLAFGGGADHGVTYRILEQDPDLDGCPEPIRSIAARCLEKDPAARPTPAEVIERCRPGATTGTADAPTLTAVAPPRSEPVTPHAPTAPGPSDPHTSPTDPASPASRADPAAPDPLTAPTPGLSLVMGGVGAAVLVLVIVLIALSLPPSTPDRPEFRYRGYEPTASIGPTGKSRQSEGMAFSPDGKTLSTGSFEGKVRLWDVRSRKPKTSFTLSDRVGNVLGTSNVTFSPDGKLLAATNQTGWVSLWDLAEHRKVRFLDNAGESVAFSPDSKLFATGSESKAVDLWATHSSSDETLAYFDPEAPATEVAFSPDGRMLASSSDDSDSNLTPKHSAKLWKVAGRDPEPYGRHEPLATLDHASGVRCVAFSPDGKTLATGSTDGKVRLWDVATRKPRATLGDTYVSSVEDLAFSPDGRTLVTNADPGMLLWNVATRKPRAVLSKGGQTWNDTIKEVAFSPDGKFIAGNDQGRRRVLLWKNPG
ncbi:WD40 repeat domain-containing serine/threonine protein kinase [Streptomyces sp. NPDC021098]|uniref:WD40 repeat domain-containing serine/threonine protein kinase n=1 Tax=unclassified Streptomyces TaxID=2593676 RepID=UPI0037AC4149